MEVALDVADLGVLSLFAVKADGAASIATARLAAVAVAHWRRARHVYALVGSIAEPEIMRAARELKGRFDRS